MARNMPRQRGSCERTCNLLPSPGSAGVTNSRCAPGRAGHRGRGAATAGVVALLTGVCGRAESEAPNWQEPASPARLVFRRPPQEDFCLLSAPAKSDSVPVTGGKAWSGSSACPVRLVWADGSHVWFLVDGRNLPESQEPALYLFTNAAVALPNVVLRDPLPVRFYAQRTAGQDLPVTREQLQILDTRVDREPFYRDLAGFEAEDGVPGGWYRGDWQRKNHLFQFSSWMLFAATGRYVCSLKTDLPVWLSVDGESVFEHPAGRHAAWTNARPQTIAAGVHYVVVRGVTRKDLSLAARWTLEGRADATEVAAVTGGENVCARLERRDRRLHALAVAKLSRAYGFEGVTNVFVPVTLESRSVAWDGGPVFCTWRFEGRELGSNRSCRAVLCAAPDTREVELRVADSHGNTAQDVVPVALDGPPRNRYRVSGRLVGLPAVAYGEDPVRPEIHVRATSPDDLDFTVETTLLRAGGGSVSITGLVDIVRSWGRLALPADTADAFSRIDWRVLHGGVVLDAGATVFERAPFCHLPDALDGDMLCAGTNTLVLLARRASIGEPLRFEGVRTGQRLLLLDGFLATGVDTNLAVQLDDALGGVQGIAPSPLAAGERMVAGGRASPRAMDAGPGVAVLYRRINLRVMETADCAEGVARLLPLVRVGALLPADVVVVAPSFEALGQGEMLAQFERRLAALAGLLSAPGRASVLLVTPPPFAILPGCEGLRASGNRPPDARQIAEIVCRVADAHGLPVIDLYTTFVTAGDRVPLIHDSSLTAAGQALAAEELRRVVYGER